MTHGIDTDFLVAVEIRDHPFHRQAEALLVSLLGDGMISQWLRRPWPNSFTS